MAAQVTTAADDGGPRGVPPRPGGAGWLCLQTCGRHSCPLHVTLLARLTSPFVSTLSPTVGVGETSRMHRPTIAPDRIFSIASLIRASGMRSVISSWSRSLSAWCSRT